MKVHPTAWKKNIFSHLEDYNSANMTDILADVDISPNPNTFNFWTSESEYIKKTGIRIHMNPFMA